MAKVIYKELKDIVDPSHTALIIWDVQNMLVDRIFEKEKFINGVNKLIESARKADIPIFFTKITPLPERFESKARLAAARNWNIQSLDKIAFELAIQPSAEDIVINKNTASIFVGTNFELMARNAGIETLVLTGIATEIGVESSARDALNRGFYAVIAEDAVSSSDKDAHERSLENLKKLAIVSNSINIADIWSR
ncbi:MAG: isochorismatase family cysteine hydrolase [Candidatus Micrarchaeia archaeon]